ncbi:carboxypeptidase regulatory-like domain-containing protein [Micromonospora sp. NPDC049559]|uniref:carboxypeptidase regulatory-like domain-containing protein n=1 Tax=Micromonospora sp. NPDC049559 TaxID=3155923 RepID=UPI003414D444
MALPDTGSISGRVKTNDGSAAGIVVIASPVSGSLPSGGSASTDEDGNYHIDGLPAGPYRVVFEHPIGQRQYHPQKAIPGDASQIWVVDGATSTVDEQLLDAGVITGQIRNRAGEPVPKLLVVIQSERTSVITVRTDADGRYRVPVFPGRYSVSFLPVPNANQRQYVPEKIDRASAEIFEVGAGDQVVADDTVLPTGSVSGRLTDARDAPLVNVTVDLVTADGQSFSGPGHTDSDGKFVIPAVLVGAYKVRYRSYLPNTQYYPGKLTLDDAELVQVRADEQATITDSMLPTGSVRIYAKDSSTGAPITRFYTDTWHSASTGVLTAAMLPLGTRRTFSVHSEDGSYFPGETPEIEVQAGKTIEVTVWLRPAARITTTVLDRVTGEPVRGVCIRPMPIGGGSFAAGTGGCADGNGQATIGELEAGSYNLFADTTARRTYGRQWVGAAGGTGDQRAAATMVAKAGVTSTAPVVLLDAAGAIAGRVTDRSTGTPLANARIGLLSGYPGPDPLGTVANLDGRYEITGLGPYDWPVQFGADRFASQWSGGTASRSVAIPIKVSAGGLAFHDAALVEGVTVSGSIENQDGVPIQSGSVTARDPVTGDIVGTGQLQDGRYSFTVLPGQSIYLSYRVRYGQRDYEGDYARQAPPRRNTRVGAAGRGTSPAARTATNRLAVSAAPNVHTAASGQSGSVPPRRPTPPAPGVYPVPASGTLIVDMVITTG